MMLYFTTTLLSVGTYLFSLFVVSQLNAGVLEASSAASAYQIEIAAMFLLLFFLITIFLLLLFRIAKGGMVYRVLFALVLWTGLMQFFQIIFPFDFAALVATLFLIGFFIVPTVWTHDIIVMLASVGIGPMFGLHFTFFSATIVLVILSIYDILAVFVTRHMVALAHAMVQHQATFALFIPQRIRDFGARISSVQPGAGFLIFGGGDLVLPMLLLTPVAKSNMVVALWGIVGLAGGILFNHFFLTLRKNPIPALPALTTGLLLGIYSAKLFMNV